MQIIPDSILKDRATFRLTRPKRKRDDELNESESTLEIDADNYQPLGVRKPETLTEFTDSTQSNDDEPIPLRRPPVVIESTPAEPTLPESPNASSLVRPRPVIYDTEDSRPPAGTNGRPIRPLYEDPLEAEQTYNRDLRTWKPTPQKGFWNRLKNAGAGALGGFLRGGLGGAIGGAVTGVFNPSLRNELWRQKELGESQGNVEAEYGQRRAAAENAKRYADYNDTVASTGLKNAQTDYYNQRPEMEARKLESAERNKRASNLVSLFNRLPEFDPNDPQNAELVKEMRELGLPVSKKTRGQQIKIIQDPRSGEWSVITTDKGTGETSSSPVTTQDGKPLVTTSREKFQQDWKTAENDKQREAILARANADRAARLQIAERRMEESRRKGEWKDDSYFREIDNQLSDTWGELSQLQDEISKRKSNGEEIPDWMRQRQASLKTETRRLELIIAKEQDKMRKGGNVPMPENQSPQPKSIKRSNLPELMKRRGFKTEQEAIDFLKQNGIVIID